MTEIDGNWSEARWGSSTADGRVACGLCPRHCRMREGQRGFCGARANRGGRLFALGYARPSAVALDPIEKKPLHHFLPGSQILSLGGVGCNLACRFCQNWRLARARSLFAGEELEPSAAVALAASLRAPAIAYTYNEPTVWAEYLCDVARLARRAGRRNVMVSNGYVSPAALPELYENIDAANIDLKALDEGFYGRMTLGRLAPVLDSLKALRRMGSVWLELTNLLIPGLNDSERAARELALWIVGELGPSTPLHLSAFRPAHLWREAPATPASTLRRASEIARAAGLLYVYCGNVAAPSETLCPGCGAVLLRREGYDASFGALDVADGRCRVCRRPIEGCWR